VRGESGKEPGRVDTEKLPRGEDSGDRERTHPRLATRITEDELTQCGHSRRQQLSDGYQKKKARSKADKKEDQSQTLQPGRVETETSWESGWGDSHEGQAIAYSSNGRGYEKVKIQGQARSDKKRGLEGVGER